jgi:MFS family permease
MSGAAPLVTRIKGVVMAYAQPSSPQSIGGVIDDGIRLFGTAFGRCWLLAIIPGLVLAVYEIAFPVSVPIYDALRQPSLLASLGHSRRLLAMDLLSSLLTLVFQGAVVVRQIAITREDPSGTLGRALAKSVRRLPGLILGLILYVLAFIGGTVLLAVVGVIIAAIVPGFLATMRGHFWAGLLIAIPLLVVALLLSVRLQLWTVALFAEDTSALGALVSSWRLTRGHWWRAGTILTVAVIMIIVLVLCFSVAGGAVAAFSRFDTVGRTALVYLFSLAASTIYYPLGAAIWLAMYHDFKLRREGGDLETRVGALNGTA